MSFRQVVSVCDSEKYFSMMPAFPSCPVISDAASRVRVTPAVVHNSFKLPDRLDELCCRFLVGYLLRYNPAPAEGGEVTLSAASFPCRFRQEQVAVMVQKRAFIEMPFKTPGQETKLVPFGIGLVVLLDEEVLLVYYGVVGQHLDSLVPCRMYGFVLGTGDGEQFGQFHPESHRDVGIL